MQAVFACSRSLVSQYIICEYLLYGRTRCGFKNKLQKSIHTSNIQVVLGVIPLGNLYFILVNSKYCLQTRYKEIPFLRTEMFFLHIDIEHK